jgi:hypothetical protein
MEINLLLLILLVREFRSLVKEIKRR